MNSVRAAKMGGHESVAIPFIGSGIFSHSMKGGPKALAKAIVEGLIAPDAWCASFSQVETESG